MQQQQHPFLHPSISSRNYSSSSNTNTNGTRDASSITESPSFAAIRSVPDRASPALPNFVPSDGLLDSSASRTAMATLPTAGMNRPAGYQPPLLPLRESPLAPKPEQRSKLDLTMPSVPGKTRKRHKVATSCNRCRQNKRKCDSGIPCSNCKRNKADCLYTDAQQSRSTWGDSPLSNEKIVGVTTAEFDDSSASSSSAPSSPTVPTSTVVTNTASTKTKKKSAVTTTAAIPRSTVLFKGSTSSVGSASMTLPLALAFSPGHASNQSSDLQRRKDILSAQSKQIAKAMRVAKSGPHFDLSAILADETSTGTIADSSTSPTATSTTSYHHPGLRPGPESASRQLDADMGHFSTVRSTDTALQVQQHLRPGTLDGRMPPRSPSTPSSSTFSDSSRHHLSPFSENDDQGQSSIEVLNRSQHTHTAPSQQRIALSYPDIGSPTFTGLPPFVPLQGGLNMAPQEYQNLTQASSLQMSLEVTGALTQQQQSIYSQQQQQQQCSENQRPRHTLQHQTDVQQDHSLVSGTTVPSQQQRYRQQISTTQEAQNDPSYTITSATPVSSTGVATQFSSTGAWGNPALRSQVQMEWRDSNATNRQQQLQDDHARFSTPPVTVSAIVPTLQFTSARLADAFPKQSAASAHAPTQSDTARDALRMRKIAKDMLDCKNYDYSIMLPRHISQEHSEFWVPPQSSSHSDLQGIPRRLLMLPKDANFLVDIFFENACFYYPVINRAVVEIHLMEPQTPQALFLLNIVFMTACKHLGRNTDIKRAIQFRERAREIQPYIDGRVRISRMQANLLGSQVIYGVFVVSIGFAEICGTYQGLPTSNNPDDSEPMIDLAAEERSLVADKGRIPEAAYQQRLWTFWGFFSRDAMSRLYFGWPHGIDTMVVNAELPKVKGCVGLGGMRKSPMGQVGVTGKRRGATMDRKQSQSEKRLMRVRAAAMQADRDAYRMKSSSVSDDEDEDEDEEDELDDESDLEQDEFAATVTSPITDKRGLPELDKRPRQLFEVGDLRSHTEPNLQALDIASASSRQQQTRDKAPSFSGLSRRFLEKQGRGEDIGRRQGSQGSVSSQYSADVRRHMDRMKVLLEAESDVTDGASYARVLFLEEIKLWTVGRRVGLYLQGRSTLQTVGSAAAGTGFYSPRDRYSSGDGSDTFGSAISATIEESRYSESAWLDDKELQGLQAELIAWEQALPPMFKFRQDVEAPDVNHKVNGKMGILMMYYYTITIMLQSSYLPIPQYLSSSPHGSVKSPESLSQEYDAVFSRAISEDSNARVKSETEEYIYTRRSLQPSINGYFNTAHQICTQLSNVLYHHVELMLDSYPNWCPIQSKLNQTLTAALRVSCLNARLNSNSKAIRDEAKAGFKMGSDLFKRQAVLPDPLTVRDWPAEEDVQVMLGLEEEFRELMTTQEEEQAMAAAQDYNEGFGGLYEDPGDHLLYPPEYQDGTTASLRNQGLALDDISQQQQQQYDLFRTEHVFGLSDEGFQFNYNIDA